VQVSSFTAGIDRQGNLCCEHTKGCWKVMVFFSYEKSTRSLYLSAFNSLDVPARRGRILNLKSLTSARKHGWV
jgi:hypothetical protein